MPSLGATYIRDVSGHAALIDSSGSLQVNVVGGLTAGAGVSGNSVNVTSGLVAVTSGIYLASGIVVNISGQVVNATVNTTTNISGQQVYLGSGSNYVTLSGASVSISGNAIASGLWLASGINVLVNSTLISGIVTVASGAITLGSGAALVMSGQAVSASGNYINITSGSTAGLSGLNVAVASGVYLASGVVVGISGQTVVASVTLGSTNITSGEIHVASGSITLGSGANAVMSGLQVFLASGSQQFISGVNVITTASVSGNYVAIISGSIAGFSGIAIGVSGQTVTVASGAIILNSGQTTIAASGVWLASGIIPNISGQAVTISGNTVGDINMGAPPMVSGFGYSGQAIPIVNSMWDFSGGAWVPLSSTTSGNNSYLEVAQAPATKMRIGLSGTAAQSGLPNSSGGTALSSGDCYVVTVRNMSGNNDMYVGDSGMRPFSGFGFVLCGGDGVTMSITNTNLVYVYATTSGQFVKWIGSQF